MLIQTQPILSICITSYNRANELARCLNSIDSNYSEKIEIIISEDCSPQREIIVEVFNKYKTNTSYKVKLNLNQENLGYDGNLAQLISLACGKYILFMSDDDIFINGAIDKTINFLEKNNYGVLFSPFKEGSKLNRYYRKEYEINPGAKNAANHIYDSILFSGLIFKREYIKNIPADRFAKLNYYQVFLFLSVLKKHPGYYLNIPLVDCIGDGENAYGIAASNDKNPYLANRESIFSNLEFHKGLIKVIKIFELDNNVSIINIFAKEYSLRTYNGLCQARKNGIKEFKKYWERLNKLDLPLNNIPKIYYLLLKIFGAKTCDLIIQFPQNLLLKYRELGLFKFD